MLDNLHMKPSNKISTYNMDFIYYVSQLGWRNNIICHCYYQGLLNWIQDPISIQDQGKPTSFQDMYALAMTINHHYWKHNCKHHYVKQAEKKALESHFQKQGKASTAGNIIAFQNKTNTSLAASSAKSSSSKPSLSSALKKQPNSLQVNLFSKLASNSKLTSDKYKKWLKNNLYLYYNTENHKLNFCSKKQTMVNPKSYSALATASEKPLEKQRVTPGLYTN